MNLIKALKMVVELADENRLCIKECNGDGELLQKRQNQLFSVIRVTDLIKLLEKE